MDTLTFPASLFPIKDHFPRLREKYSRFFVGDITSPPPGWQDVLELALEESASIGERFCINGFVMSQAGLAPVFAEGHSLRFCELLAETADFCPFCGQPYPPYKEGE